MIELHEITMPEFIDIVRNHTDKVDIIFEVGALDAKDSLLFKQSFPDANVYAFEGLPENYEMYMKDLENIYTFNKVVFNYDGKTIFHKKEINGIHGVFDRGSAYGTETLSVKCYRLDSICRDLNVDHIDMIKIDVEGATYEVLDGMGDILNTVKIMHIETEDHEGFKGQKFDNYVTQFLLDKGFKILKKFPCVENNKGEFQFDSVWIKDN